MAQRDHKYKERKKVVKPKHVTCHVFAETIRVVPAPHGFACVVTLRTWMYIPGFIKFHSGVLEPRGSKVSNYTHYGYMKCDANCKNGMVWGS